MKTLRAAAGIAALIAVVVMAYLQSKSGGVIELTLWHTYSESSLMNKLLEEFNASVGREHGIKVTAKVVLGSEYMDEPLIAVANDDESEDERPDIFTAYTRAAIEIGTDRLIDWREMLTSDDISGYEESFLVDGVINGRLVGLPISKATNLAYVNITSIGNFSNMCHECDTPISPMEDMFQTAKYFSRYMGKAMIHFDDIYSYFTTSMASLSSELVVLTKNDGALPTGRLDIMSDTFERVFMPFATSAAAGGVHLEDGYGSTLWNIDEIAISVASSAGILYSRDYVTLQDGTDQPINFVVVPLPPMRDAYPTAVQRGASFFAFRSGSERRDEAIATFAKWITLGEANLRLSVSAGYLPVTREGLEALASSSSEIVEDPHVRRVYEAYEAMSLNSTNFAHLPIYRDAREIERRFVSAVRESLIRAQNDCQGLDISDERIDEAARAALASIREELADISVIR